MAQSKKHQLKTIQRRCQRAGRTLALLAYRSDNVALLDVYGQLRFDIRETLKQLRRAPGVDLEHMTLPVTCADVDHLGVRLKALQCILVASDVIL
jgi:hypothetical protein